MTFKLPLIYPITDTTLSGLSHHEQARQLLDAGARMVQVRDKKAPSRELYDECAQIARLVEDPGVRIIVNDRADVAVMAGANGVHVGQDDLPPAAVRAVVGDRMVVGFSTHNVEQAIRATKLPIDYIAIGPIFSTRSKANPDPVVGLEGLRTVRDTVGDFPLVAIGGIDRTNVERVLSAGANSAAVINALFSDSLTIAENYRELAILAERAATLC